MSKENFELLNLMAKRVVETYNTWLNPLDVLINQSLETAEHYTISTLIPKELASKIHVFAKEMGEVDPSLILNEPDLYHFTTFWCPLTADIDLLRTGVESKVKSYPLSFSVNGFIFGPIGVSLKLYPTNETLCELRESLSKITGSKFQLDERGVTSWISLCRYTQPPKPELKKYIQEHASEDFGIYTPDTIGFYRSSNKNFIGTTELFSIKNG